jgi:hypothetical protein
MANETTQKLTSEQEKCLVEWIKELETQGKAPSYTMVREMACKIIDSNTLGKHWVERFIKRHPEITSCIGIPLESARALNSTPNIIAGRPKPNSESRHPPDDIWTRLGSLWAFVPTAM